MAYDDERADGQSATSISCRLCCTPSVAVGQQHPIAATDDGGTRPGGRGLRDTIVKHLRIQVSEPYATSVGVRGGLCPSQRRAFAVAAVLGGAPTVVARPTVHHSTSPTPRPRLEQFIVMLLYYQR